jgi:ATP-binding cassette subfamily B protein
MTNTNGNLKLSKYIWYCLWTQSNLITRLELTLSIIVILFTVGIKLSVPFFLKQIVALLSDNTTLWQLSMFWLVICYVSMWCISQNMQAIRDIIIRRPSSKACDACTINLITHLHNLSIRYHMDRKTGEILSAFKEIRYAYPLLVETFMSDVAPLMIEAICTVAILSYFYSVSFAITLLVMFILYNLLTYHTSKNITVCRETQNKCNAASSTFIVDSLLNAETVKLFNAQNYEAREALRLLQDKEDADVNILKTDAKIHLLQNLIVGCALTFMTVLAGTQAWHDQINVSDFIFIYGYIFIFMQPLSKLGYQIRQSRDYITRLNLIINVLNQPIEITDKVNAADLHINKGTIRFENVSFSYNSDREILHNISFEVPNGKTVAIVGATGSGKSTISRLLFRLYNLNQGTITIDGQNIAEVTKGSLRESIGIVPQDCLLFNDTLGANIRYGKLDCTTGELLQAINDAEIDAVISKLPDKLDTIVGERGLRLSGGEKQRVAMARMLIKKPKIMVFDEATSSLDAHVERQIQNNIRRISKDVTTLIIAHRLSTITYADSILVMDHGEIKERGTHAELLAKNGLYAELWKRQFEGEDEN